MSNSTILASSLLVLSTYAGPAVAQTALAALSPQQIQTTATETPPSAAPQSLKSALEELKSTYGVTFFYSDQLVEGKFLPKDHPAFNSWQEELRYSLGQLRLQVEKLEGNTYIISPLPPAAPAPVPARNSAPTLAADVPVSGRVVGTDGQGLPGVTVLVKGTSIGASTNIDGSFSLTAPEGSTLVFSYVGYKTQEASVGNGPISVTLAVDEQKLNEVVVVGYGTQRREDVTGAIASVTEQEIKTQPVAGLDQALQGKAAGVQVSQNSGAPGGGVSIRVRGV